MEKTVESEKTTDPNVAQKTVEINFYKTVEIIEKLIPILS